MRRTTFGLLVVVLSLVSLPCLAAPPTGAPGPAERFDAVRLGLLDRVNALRRQAGTPPLALDPRVGRAAQAHADDLARQSDLKMPKGSAERMQARLAAAGYQAARWFESVTATSAPLDSLLGDWRREQPREFTQAMAPDLRHLGIGISRQGRLQVYVLVFAAAREEAFERETAALQNLSAVRKKMLAAVDEVRRKARLSPPLAPSPTLDTAAQRHADDQLRRSYFAHENPEKETVRERADAAGYAWRAIGENLAEGQTSVEQVVDSWLRSPEHRAVMLDPDFRDLGLGLARGRDGGKANGELRVIWVLVLGAPQAAK